MVQPEEILIQLLRFSLGDSLPSSMPSSINWNRVLELSVQQGVSAIAADGVYYMVSHFEEFCQLGEDILNAWHLQTILTEREFYKKLDAACALSEKWSTNGLCTYVLKGFSISQLYLTPSHRGSCDIDVFPQMAEGQHCGRFSAWEWANELMKGNGVIVDSSDYRHSFFIYRGVKFENHRFCASNVKGHKKSKMLDAYLKKILRESLEYNFIEGTKLISPPALFSSLLFIQHAYSHFFAERITLRYIYDWGMLLKSFTLQGEDFWNCFSLDIKEYGLADFTDSLTRLTYYVTGIGAPWINDYSLQKQDYRLLNDCFYSASKQITYEYPWNTYFQLAMNRIRCRWKYKYFTKSSLIVDLLSSVWGVMTD